MAKHGTVRIGISGWSYKGWRGVFYPPGLAHAHELSYAAAVFPTIEVNGTFYSLQQPNSFAKWTAATPGNFVFAIKGSRYITHILRLKRIRKPLANFFASGLLRLGAKLGPLLWQLPPNFKFDPRRIDEFLKVLPFDTESAVELAHRHDKRVSGRSWLQTDQNRRIRHAIEIRSNTFVAPEFIELLRAYNVALVCADSVEWPFFMDATSDFAYCRLHGSEQLYASGYDDESLDKWATRVTAWAWGRTLAEAKLISPNRCEPATLRDVYVYFDNDAKARAPVDAQTLTAKVEKLLKK